MWTTYVVCVLYLITVFTLKALAAVVGHLVANEVGLPVEGLGTLVTLVLSLLCVYDHVLAQTGRDEWQNRHQSPGQQQIDHQDDGNTIHCIKTNCRVAERNSPQNGCEGIGGGTVPVLIGEDLLAVFALVDGLIAILTLLLEVFTERVEDGASAGARVLLVPPQLQGRGEQLVTVLAAVHLLVCTHTRTRAHTQETTANINKQPENLCVHPRPTLFIHSFISSIFALHFLQHWCVHSNGSIYIL